MTESASKTRGRIQAVKQWLNRAEENFSHNAPVRGEMDLLLAEAELRSTRERLQAGQGGLRMSWIAQGIAFAIAAVIAAVGMGTAWWWWQDAGAESVPPVYAAPAAPVSHVQAQYISAAPLPKPVLLPAAAVDSTSSGQEVKNADRPAIREPSVSQNEMKQLIQAAGQSLRGRTK